MAYSFNGKIKDQAAATKGTNVRLRSAPSTSGSVLTTYANPVEIGLLTGYFQKDGSYFWHQVKSFDGKLTGWLRNDLMTVLQVSSGATIKTIKTSDDADAQKMMDEIIAQDKQTMGNLNHVAAMIEQLKAKGVNTATSANKLTAIFKRLQARQDGMQKSTWAKVKDKVSDAWGSVKRFFGFSGMGELITIAVIVVAGIVVGAGTTALVYLKPWKNESTIDLKESKELKALLESADPATAEKIRKDLYEQVKDAYTTGDRQGSFASYWKIGKVVLFAGLTLWLAPRFLDMVNGLSKPKQVRN